MMLVTHLLVVVREPSELMAPYRTRRWLNWLCFYHIIILIVLVLVRSGLQEAIGLNLDNISFLLLLFNTFSHNFGMGDL